MAKSSAWALCRRPIWPRWRSKNLFAEILPQIAELRPPIKRRHERLGSHVFQAKLQEICALKTAKLAFPVRRIQISPPWRIAEAVCRHPVLKQLQIFCKTYTWWALRM